MFKRTTPRPAEHLHTKQCLAGAMISAIENLRDEPLMTDLFFRHYIQDGGPLDLADTYLQTMPEICKCGPCACCDDPCPTDEED